MTDEPFIMLSLKGDKTKKLANALTNKSADKILAYLANNEGATEAQIAKALKIPVSTVNYTMKVLVDAKLVIDDEYSYSQKGREVNHYKLAKKYIIIAPDDEQESFFDKFKKYIPAFGITVGVAAVYRLFQEFTSSHGLEVTAQAVPMAADAMMEVGMMRAEEAVNNTALKTAEAIHATPEPTVIVQYVPADWFPYFLLGTFVMLVIFMLIEHLRSRT